MLTKEQREALGYAKLALTLNRSDLADLRALAAGAGVRLTDYVRAWIAKEARRAGIRGSDGSAKKARKNKK